MITDFLWRITAFPLRLQSANFTHRFPVSREYALLIHVYWGYKCGEFELVAAGVFVPLGQPHSSYFWFHSEVKFFTRF